MKCFARLCLLLMILMPCAVVSASDTELQHFKVTFTNAVQAFLANRKYSFASGLSFRKHARGRALEFYAVSEGPVNFKTDAADPESAPLIATIKIKKEKAEIDRVVPLSLAPGIKPPASGNLQIEGVVAAKDGDIWLADTAGPSLLRVDGTEGTIKEWLVAGAGLPEWLALSSNQGFEAISILPSGELLAALKKPIADPEGVESAAGLIRILRYKPESRTSTVYLFKGDDKDFSDVEISAMQTVSGERFLVLEEGNTADSKRCSRIVELNTGGSPGIKDAKEFFGTEVTGTTHPLHHAYLKRTIIVSLCETGWSSVATEGLAFAGNGSQLAVINNSGEGEELEIAILTLPETLIPFRFADLLVLIVLAIITAAMIGFLLAVVFSKKKTGQEE